MRQAGRDGGGGEEEEGLDGGRGGLRREEGRGGQTYADEETETLRGKEGCRHTSSRGAMRDGDKAKRVR